MGRQASGPYFWKLRGALRMYDGNTKRKCLKILGPNERPRIYDEKTTYAGRGSEKRQKSTRRLPQYPSTAVPGLSVESKNLDCDGSPL